MAGQLDIADPSVVKRYTARPMTAYEHAWQIRRVYGYRDFADAEAGVRLREFLAGRPWTHAEGPVALFSQAVAWLRRHRVLLPGVSGLARLVTTARAEAAGGLHRTVAEAATAADPGLPGRLPALLDVLPGQRVSEWGRLRRAPVRTSGPVWVPIILSQLQAWCVLS